MPALIPILIVVLAFDIFCLVDLHRAEEARNLSKWAWTVLIVIHPLVGIGYLILGKTRKSGTAGLGMT